MQRSGQATVLASSSTCSALTLHAPSRLQEPCCGCWCGRLSAVLRALGDAGEPNGTKLRSSHLGDQPPLLCRWSMASQAASLLLLPLSMPNNESALRSLCCWKEPTAAGSSCLSCSGARLLWWLCAAAASCRLCWACTCKWCATSCCFQCCCWTRLRCCMSATSGLGMPLPPRARPASTPPPPVLLRRLMPSLAVPANSPRLLKLAAAHPAQLLRAAADAVSAQLALACTCSSVDDAAEAYNECYSASSDLQVVDAAGAAVCVNRARL